tara:strand:+ start:486 stop:788 length:303 start_codon:yes stop_codon:yes gene_type:complete
LSYEIIETKKKPSDKIKALNPIINPTLFLKISDKIPAGKLIKPAEILLAEARYPICTPLRESESFIKGNITEIEEDNTCFKPCPKDRKYRRRFFLKYAIL